MTATFYPDANPETTSVDGRVYRDGVDQSWAAIIAGAGTTSNDYDTSTIVVGIAASATLNQWITNQRSIFLFDTSGLPDTAVISSLGSYPAPLGRNDFPVKDQRPNDYHTPPLAVVGSLISAATLSLYGLSKVDWLAITPDVNIYASTPALNTGLANADYGQLGSTAFSTAITYAAFNSAGYNDFTLNAAGIAAINKIGVSKFGARNANYDAAGSAPAWQDSRFSQIIVGTSEWGAGFQPKLVVTYSMPC